VNLPKNFQEKEEPVKFSFRKEGDVVFIQYKGVKLPDQAMIGTAILRELLKSIDQCPVTLVFHLENDAGTEPYLKATLTSTHITLETQDNHFNFDAELRDQDNQILAISTTLVVQDPTSAGQESHSKTLPHLKELFSFALSYFEVQGYDIKVLLASWHSPLQYPKSWPISTNHQLFFKNYDPAKRNHEKAALLTPTGKLASREGFSQVIFPVLGFQPSHIFRVEELVIVYFCKPDFKMK
jgi:hypothetical protein